MYVAGQPINRIARQPNPASLSSCFSSFPVVQILPSAEGCLRSFEQKKTKESKD
jgi:hypothetical protein